jgi:hypothetical protein
MRPNSDTAVAFLAGEREKNTGKRLVRVVTRGKIHNIVALPVRVRTYNILLTLLCTLNGATASAAMHV